MADPQLSLVHLVRQPSQPSAGSPPLLLLCHGLGSDETDLFGLSAYLDPRFLVISVRAPVPHGPGYTWFDLQILPDRILADMQQAAQALQTLQTFLQEAISTYNVDPQQVYLMGFSQGAIMSLYLTLTDPHKVAGMVAMSGRLPKEVEPLIPVDADSLKDKPILVVHGLYDPVLPIEDGRYIRDRLQTLPVQLTYREYAMGHQVSQESLVEITRWLTERLQSR